MSRILLAILLTVLAAASQSSCIVRSPTDTGGEPTSPVKGCDTLDKMPFREAWYGMYFKEDKVGYSHFKIEPDGGNFNIFSDSIMRLTALKKTNEITMKEKVVVQPDLRLISFDSKVHMNDKDLHMVGKTEGNKFLVDVEVEGEKFHREYPVDGKLFHSSAISLMPVLRGLRDGEKYSFGVFNAERQGLEKVEQEIATVKGEPGPHGAVWRVKNHYGKTPVFSWLDKKGLTVLEKARDGALITVLEDEAAAKQFLEKKTSAKDLITDVSLIKVAESLPNPGKLRYLRLRVKGIDPSLIAEDHRQRVSVPVKSGQSEFEVTVQVEDTTTARRKDRLDPTTSEDLASTIVIPSNHKEIVSQAEKIALPSDSAEKKVNKLVKWTADNIENKMKDSFTALTVLRSKEGECQSHANLYAALARALEVPTRVVTGLVYTENVGFLYHAWAESYVNGWLAVDPTLKQVPSDATHIKIASADGSDETGSILNMVGHVKLDVLDYR
jgi:hypothetical protein